MRWSLLLVACAGCGATIQGGDGDNNPDAAIRDDAPPIDAAPPVDAPRACAGGDAAMVAGDGSCVVRFNTLRTFAAAQAACVAFGARLAIADSAVRDATVRTLAGPDNVWIGLSDEVTEGTFVWIDNSPLIFANFAMGEPNNAGDQFQEDCAMYAGARAGWDDRPCAPIAGVTTPGEYAYLCMYND
jgi:hypothetical protein